MWEDIVTTCNLLNKILRGLFVPVHDSPVTHFSYDIMRMLIMEKCIRAPSTRS